MRAERIPEVLQLHAQGLNAREIGERLGISRSYAAALLWDPDRTKELARRERYRGVCEVCGAPTTGSEGATRAPTHCKVHNPGGERRAQQILGKGPAQRDLCILIGDGIDRFIELAEAYEVSKGYMGATLDRMLRNGLVERVARGRYRLTAKGQALADSEPG